MNWLIIALAFVAGGAVGGFLTVRFMAKNWDAIVEKVTK